MILFYLFSYYNYCISYNMYLSRIILLYILMETLTIRVQCNWHSVHSVHVCVCMCVCVLGGYWSWLQDYSSNVSVPTPPYL